MEIAILGLPQSGKSTLFQIMTGLNSKEIYGETQVVGVAKVPDERFDKLVEIFKPAKSTPATIPFVDVCVAGEKGLDTIRQKLSSVDGIIHIVDCFTIGSITEISKRYKQLEDELILSDLIIVERNIERAAKTPNNPLSKTLLNLKKHLESGAALREFSFTKEEFTALKNYSFWSLKPALIVLNTAEGKGDLAGEFKKSTGVKSHVLSICCQIELEISAMPAEDQKSFLESLGIKTPAFHAVIQSAFAQLERIYYFTVGEDEVKAWVIKKNSTAPQAAAAIHKDFERGFIKAEVVSYNDFILAGGDMTNVKSAGKLRLEGKEYIVKDGDIISFRFNV